MAKEGFYGVFDLQPAGSGWDAVSGSNSTKAATVGIQEYGKGLRGQVFAAKFVKIEAETEKEAAEQIRNWFGSDGGITITGKSSGFKTEEI